MLLRHDPAADAIYITMREGTAFERGVMLDERRVVDFDTEGQIRGVELLYVSDGVDVRGLPDEAAVAELLAVHGIAIIRPAPVP